MRGGLRTRAEYSARLFEFGLIVVLALLPFFWRLLADAGDLPAGDAWAYERIFDTYHATGHLRLVGWNDITLVGVIPVTSLWVAIVGYGHHQLHLLGSVMCACALLGFRSLLITFGVARRIPALLLFAGFSGFVGIAGTYLSDSFAIAGAVWAVALACRVTHPRDREWPRWANVAAVIGAALAASFGFLVRQQMAVAALAAAWLLLGRRPFARDRVVRAALFAATFAAVSVPVYLWRSGLEHGGKIEFDLHMRGMAAGAEAMFVAQGLLLFATLLWVHGLHPVTKRGAAIVGCIALAEFAAMAGGWSQVVPAHPLVSGIQEQYGLDGGAVALIAILAAATTGWVWTARACVEWRDRGVHLSAESPLRHPLAAVALLAIAVEATVVVATGAYWTRYSLFMAVATIVVLLARPLQRSAAALAITIAVLLASYWELDHSLTPTEAIKEAAAITSCLGIAPEHLDATFSWDGKYYTGIASVYRGDLVNDGLPITHDWSTFPAMQRDAVLTRANPGNNDAWLVIGPISSSALIPTTQQDWWLTVRRSAITTADQASCLDR
ncbi:MAG: hypothetical protein K8R99_01765 [Actinomycetia bacterium]|nr:hypothetical protein [Actinomycetes bacterium]